MLFRFLDRDEDFKKPNKCPTCGRPIYLKDNTEEKKELDGPRDESRPCKVINLRDVKAEKK